MTAYTTRIIASEDEMESLYPSWDRCRRQHPQPHIGQRPEWLLSEVRSEGERGGRPMVAALYEGEELAGVAPFLIREEAWPCRLGYKTLFRFPLTRAVFLGETVMAPETSAAQENLLTALAEAKVPYQMAFLECLPTASAFYRRLKTSAAVNKHFWVYVPDGVTPHRSLDLSGTLDDYYSKFSGRTRRKLQQNIRKLDKACGGKMEFVRVTRPDQVREFMQAVEAVSAKSWQGQSLGKALRADEATIRRFEEYAERGWLRSYLLKNGDEPIAFGIGFQADGVYHYDTIGFDQGWFSFGPGKVLFCLLLEDLFREDPPKRLDCGYGENDYKLFFANHACDSANVYLVRKSAYTALALACHWACARGSLAARYFLERMQLREKVRHRLRGRGETATSPGVAPPSETEGGSVNGASHTGTESMAGGSSLAREPA